MTETKNRRAANAHEVMSGDGISTATGDFRKVLRIGKARPAGTERGYSVFVKVEYKGGRLSLTGVEGPMQSGNARGGCGQIDMGPWEIREYAPGWNKAAEEHLREVWGRWHLNDMRAGCEHQKGPGWDASREVEIVTYKLTRETLAARRRIEESAKDLLLAGEVVQYHEDERRLLSLPYTTTAAPDADSAGSGCYEVEKREEKGIGWIYPAEHPAGILCKPCPVCGYKYGSEWRREEVPAEVLAWLRGLPDTDVQPAWI